MPVELSTKHFRGVMCRYCGKPVRIPSIVQRKDSEDHGLNTNAGDSRAHSPYSLVSRVFVLRCRSCERESIYAIDQIVDCTLAKVRELGRLAHSAAAS
jgi:hypothetical protein